MRQYELPLPKGYLSSVCLAEIVLAFRFLPLGGERHLPIPSRHACKKDISLGGVSVARGLAGASIRGHIALPDPTAPSNSRGGGHIRAGRLIFGASPPLQAASDCVESDCHQ